ncbi:MAG: leucine-rich repeat protein [Clostridia bacterium]|nr:leucine-rich repeat protein [Clostridia bacterium]
MERKTRKILAIMLVLIMAISVAPVGVFADNGKIVETAEAVGISDNKLDAEGKCGEDVAWSYDEETGVLNISGTGDMTDYKWDESPFYKSAVKTVVIENGVTSIGAFIFSECSALSSVAVPDSVTAIRNGAFRRCGNLARIMIPDSVEAFGNNAFYNCKKAVIVCHKDSAACKYAAEQSIPYEIAPPASGRCGENVTWSYDWETAALTISGTGDMYDYDWDKSPFYDTGVRTVTIEAGVAKIGASAFANCSNLSSVSVPGSVKAIGDFAFENCSSLTSLNLSDNVSSIGEDSFHGCENLTVVCSYASYAYEFVRERSIKHVFVLTAEGKCGENVSWSFDEESGVLKISGTGDMYDYDWNTVSPFYRNSKIKTVMIGEGVTSIGGCAFEECKELTKVIVSYSVVKINKYAFSGCSALNDIKLGDGVKEIGDFAFEECSSLETIDLPDSLENIGEFAFAFCSSLREITIPGSVKRLGESSFYGCEKLIDITIGNGVTRIGADAFAKTGYENDEANWENNALYIGKYLIKAGDATGSSCEVKEGTKLIADYAFSSCKELTNITLPSSVENIGVDAFSGTAYYNDEANWENGVLYIGKHLIKAKETVSGAYSVKSGTVCLADYAFDGCKDLEKVTVPDSVKNIGEGSFAGCSKATVFCNTDTAAHKYALENDILFELLDYVPVYVSVGFDANGGSCKEASRSVEKGKTIGTLPVATRDGYTFDGWFTSKNGGDKIEASTVISSEITVFAHWTEIPMSVHSVTVDDLSVTYRDSRNLSLKIIADEAASYTVTYSSSNPSVVSVDNSGNVYGAKRGSATIVVTVTDSTGKSVQDTCNVNVDYAWWQWIIMIVLFGWLWGY